MESWSSIAFGPRLERRRAPAECAELALHATPISGDMRRHFTDYHTVPQHQRADSIGERAYGGFAGAGRPQRLAAVLSAVRPQLASQLVQEAKAAGREDRGGNRRVDRGSIKDARS